MSKYAIRVSGVSKEYVIGDIEYVRPTLRDVLASKLRAPQSLFRKKTRGRSATRSFEALHDVSFDVEQGEVLGVIGRNGAGKSTLLKILARITAPTAGRVEIYGRIASLLEVGTGFHPELSGRENIYLNGAILGMSRAEISRKFDEIVEFSGVEKFLDTPVKRYSSGMYVRLAFAVAAHLEPEILVIDEVLAVGDTQFQKKCLGKMQDVASAGRTVLFVSHNPVAVRNLCTRTILLESGRVAFDGGANEALGRYTLAGRRADGVLRRLSNERCQIETISICQDEQEIDVFVSATRSFTIDVSALFPFSGEFGIHLTILSENGEKVLASGSFFGADEKCLVSAPGAYMFSCEIPGHFLNDGQYIVDLHVLENRRDVLIHVPGAIEFTVADDFPQISGWHWRPEGLTRPLLQWRSQSLGRNEIMDRQNMSQSIRGQGND